MGTNHDVKMAAQTIGIKHAMEFVNDERAMMQEWERQAIFRKKYEDKMADFERANLHLKKEELRMKAMEFEKGIYGNQEDDNQEDWSR